MKKELFCKTDDNVKIAINHYKNNKEAVLIVSPGWFMTKDSQAFQQISEFFFNEFDVICIDFRGHGKSSGFYTFTSFENKDISCVVKYAKEKYEKIYLLGFSLGGAISLNYAATDKDIDKLIVVSAPCDFWKIENQMWKKEAWLPTFQKFELNRWFSIRPSLIIRKKIKPIEIVDKISAPTLFIAGENDPTVHCWHTKALFEKAVCKKYFVLFKNAKHSEDLFIEYNKKFTSICMNWLSN